MTKIAYLQCPTGLSGDMCLGALVHAGVPLEYLIETLNRLGISQEFKLWAEGVHRHGQAATKVHVDLLAEHSPHAHSHSDTRHLPEIETLIGEADLPTRATAWSLAVFRKLAEAEGAVHGLPPEQVHFHEVGATDAIVDIVGTCLGLDWLGIEQLYCSALPTGGGMVRAAHGLLSVPTPAVLKLWEMRQVPIYSNGLQRELVTPTGAAIATTLATGFGPPPAMTLQRIGLGAGSRELAMPNILQLWLGETESPAPQASHQHIPEASHSLVEAAIARDPHPHPPAPSTEIIAVLETQIDDLNPQAIAYTCERLFEVGAVDVFTQAIAMKKSRLGTLLTVICPPSKSTACQTVLFQETTTLGIRQTLQERTILQREWATVETPYGKVRIKLARLSPQGEIINAQPEYEDCAHLAKEHQIPWQQVQESARLAWHQQQSSEHYS
ncbi:MAG TPA: nickel pincer cofactor biosynthesis protein LarC [Synechococcales cyanobacterium M55_K2018_004]|nr:nickel pincer cofactor biosynthesis protein LarC [Synechococcales cyanobacterium M55_K2018_004]